MVKTNGHVERACRKSLRYPSGSSGLIAANVVPISTFIPKPILTRHTMEVKYGVAYILYFCSSSVISRHCCTHNFHCLSLFHHLGSKATIAFECGAFNSGKAHVKCYKAHFCRASRNCYFKKKNYRPHLRSRHLRAICACG